MESAKSDGNSGKSCTREGWLTKKGQRRYFTLSKRILSWKSHPLSGEVKKSIDVHQFEIDFGESQIPTIVIKPSVIAEPTFTAHYELEARDWVDANAWLECLRQASRDEKDKTAFGKEGWLEKKGQKRWFLLHKENGMLYWFTKEQDRNTDFTRNVKGQLSTSVITDVSPVVTGALTKQKPAFRISTSIPGLEYILTAKTWSEMVDWIAAVHTCGIKATPAKPPPSATGYLMKKGKKRFFVLEKDTSSCRHRLSWYANDKTSPLLGGISLEGCTIEYTRDKASFVVAMPNAKRYELTAKSQQEATEWFTRISEAISQCNLKDDFQQLQLGKDSKATKQGWLMKKGQRRYFIFTDDTLMWFVDEPDSRGDSWMKHIKGSLTFGPGCQVGIHTPFCFYIETARGYSYQLTAAAAREADEWVEVLRSRLTHHMVPIRPIEAVKETKPEGDSWTDWRSLHVVRTTSSNSLPKIEQAPISLGTSPPKTGSKIFSGVVDSLSSDSAVVQAGWLMKKGKRRWFLLTSVGELIWYEREHSSPPPDIKPKGVLTLVGCSTKEVDEQSFIIFSPWGQSYTLTESSSKKRDIWISSLKLCIQKANLLEEKLAADTHIVKTGWLEKKGKRRWFALLKEDKALLWFANPHPRYRITTEHAKGAMELVGCSLDNSQNTVTIGGTKILTLIACSTQEADEWFGAIRGVQQGTLTSTA